MRIPFPERVQLWHAGVFAVILCLFELLLGTQPLFVLCVFLYIMMAAIAFNIAGGLYRASGAYVFASSLLGLIIGQCAKVFLGEAADSNLRTPMTTVFVYLATMAATLLGVALSRRLIPRVTLLERGEVPDDTRQIGIGCIAMGIILPLLEPVLGGGNGSIGSALNQFQQFLPLGITLATYDQIRSTKGRSSLNVIIFVGGLYMFLWGGILGTSKQAMFTPLAAYATVCGSLRYRFRPVGVATIAMVGFLMFYYFIPYSQVVRNYTRDITDLGERAQASINWLENLDEVRIEYAITDQDFELVTGPHYFTQDRGFLERLTTLAMDDALIDVTETSGQFGLRPIIIAVENTVPHALWANKPDYTFGNTYAHEIGVLSEDDYTTGISFGPGAGAYHMGGWSAVFILMPIVLFALFVVVDSVTGSIKTTPWGLAYTVYFLHAGPEANLGALVGVIFTVTGILVVTVFVARLAMPIVGSLLFPERRRSVLMHAVREFPGMAQTIQPAAVADKPV